MIILQNLLFESSFEIFFSSQTYLETLYFLDEWLRIIFIAQSASGYFEWVDPHQRLHIIFHSRNRDMDLFLLWQMDIGNFHAGINFNRGSFRTGSTGSWEPVNFKESYAEGQKFWQKTSKHFKIPKMQNSGTGQLKFP